MVQVKQLSNGMTVVLERMEHLRSVSIGVWVKVGSANENIENNGIAHMIEHMLFKGTRNRSAKDLADDMSMIGGNMNAYTSKECTSYYVTTLDSHLPIAVDILGDMICNSIFAEDDIEKEKGVIIEEIDMYDDSPDDLVHELLQKNTWEDHPLGYIISGTKENVNRFSRKQLLEFMNQFYVADNMVISVVGGFDENMVMELLERYFSKVPKTGKRIEVTKPSYVRNFTVREKDIEQVHMNLAFDCVDYTSKDKYLLSIVNSVLGGSESSKLFQIIREEMGLTYSIFSYGSTYSTAGLFHIDAILNPSKLEKVFSGIIKVINDFKVQGITEHELQRVKEQINTELIIGSESSKNRMNSYGKAMLCRGRIMSLDETIACLNQITREDVLRFANQYLTLEQVSIALIGNVNEGPLTEVKDIWSKLS